MSILSKSLISSNLSFAIANRTVTLTHVTPTNAEVYSANKQDVEVAFTVMENGREETIDTRFYIDRTKYTTLPKKGDILTDGTRQYKVVNTHTDAADVTLRTDCEARYQG